MSEGLIRSNGSQGPDKGIVQTWKRSTTATIEGDSARCGIPWISSRSSYLLKHAIIVSCHGQADRRPVQS